MLLEDSKTESEGPGEGMSLVTKILLGVVVVTIAASAYFFYSLNDKINTLQAQQTTSEQQQEKKIGELSSQIKADREMLASKLGMTEKELAARAAELRRSQQAAESRLAEQQTAVSTAVTGVKTEVTNVETDVASTKSDLAATKAKLEHTIGDLGLQSGLIAHTRDELDTLKHRGDRNYYEFTLRKGKNRTPVSTISLELRKTDAKKNKYTLDVLADDRTIEKKDRNIFEPLQFYTGRDHLLYELVVNDIQRDQISGYLSTPKNAPLPAVQ
jgi:flagellar basal body-associated protein FliL